jgi:transcriptional regulator
MGYGAGPFFARRRLELEKIYRGDPRRENNFLRPIGGHPGAPRGAKVGTSYNQIDQNYCAAIFVSCVNGAEAMPEFDWRSPESYKSLQNADITDIAWECLRRNVDYQRDYHAMIANSPDGQVTLEFRRRWGICFRS